MSLLAVRDLVCEYDGVRAVDGVDLDVDAGESVGVVGESGAGKSTAVEAALGLRRPASGTVRFDGRDVTGGDERLRRETAMVFQDAGTTLDPRMRVVETVAEPLAVRGVARRERRDRARAALDGVGLPDAGDRYPASLSGGERQRVAIARALVGDPALVVADEPTTGLDAAVQADLLELLADLRRDRGLALVLVSHDVRVVRAVCDRVAVLHAGRVVERGPTDAVLDNPAHPYTEALAAAVPRPDPQAPPPRPLDGPAPDPADPPDGCRFHPRCPSVIPDAGDRETLQAVLGFRAHLARGDPVPEDPAAVRATFGLPDEDALAAAAEAATRGDRARALDRLDAAFPTPCVADRPDLRRVGDREVACHRHEPTDS